MKLETGGSALWGQDPTVWIQSVSIHQLSFTLSTVLLLLHLASKLIQNDLLKCRNKMVFTRRLTINGFVVLNLEKIHHFYASCLMKLSNFTGYTMNLDQAKAITCNVGQDEYTLTPCYYLTVGNRNP
jgi:hypothetical protein